VAAVRGRVTSRIRRSIAKAVVGDSVVFEEHHAELGLTFGHRWGSAEHLGFVRTATLTNHGTGPVRVDVLDGLLDLLPAGLEPLLYARYGNLTHAYKRSELVDAGLAVYSLEAPVSDRAEPAEVLRATVAWSSGFGGRVTLDAGAVAAFDAGCEIEPVRLLTGVPGAYLLDGELDLAAGASASWHIVADVGRDHADIAALRRALRQGPPAPAPVEATRRSGEHLVRIMAPVDAAQRTGDAVACAHHVANVTYNVMRGGVPLDGYQLDTVDVASFVAAAQPRRRGLGTQDGSQALPATDRPTRAAATAIAELDDVHLERLGPRVPAVQLLAPTRRSQPSRGTRSRSGSPTMPVGRSIHYEGNWRDVFQNWEATVRVVPRVPPERGGGVRRRVDGRRPQPVPDQPGRHRLGGARPR
jgi:hypothetical protein